VTESDPPLDTAKPHRQEQLPASEEITELAPGVLRLQVPIFFTGLGHVNCYALLDSKGASIVDAGMPGKATWVALTGRLKAAGLKVRDIHTVIITHSHPDHFGSAGRLAHEAGADLVTERRFHTWLEKRPRPNSAQAGNADSHAHGDACDEIVAGSAGEATDDYADIDFFSTGRETPWGGSPIPNLQRTRRAARLARLRLIPYLRPPIPTRLVTNGDHLHLAKRDWQAVYTPGHTGDHLCLYDPEEQLLLSGDHVLPTITPHVPGLSPLADPLGAYMASLEKVRSLGDVKLVLPAHGHPFPNLSERIDQILEHHSSRLSELETYLATGTATVVELSHELFKQPRWGMMAESETYAHLEYLRIRGRAERLAINGQAAYRAP
jgi:glyoxylase-like metal-dependent hydrolase (beta-lactamase superfamily II)